MKTLAILIALALAGCADFEGNGITLGVEYTDPDSGTSINLRTAK